MIHYNVVSFKFAPLCMLISAHFPGLPKTIFKAPECHYLEIPIIVYLYSVDKYINLSIWSLEGVYNSI